jgi:hypothetical protein
MHHMAPPATSPTRQRRCPGFDRHAAGHGASTLKWVRPTASRQHHEGLALFEYSIVFEPTPTGVQVSDPWHCRPSSIQVLQTMGSHPSDGSECRAAEGSLRHQFCRVTGSKHCSASAMARTYINKPARLGHKEHLNCILFTHEVGTVFFSSLQRRSIKYTAAAGTRTQHHHHLVHQFTDFRLTTTGPHTTHFTSLPLQPHSRDTLKSRRAGLSGHCGAHT